MTALRHAERILSLAAALALAGVLSGCAVEPSSRYISEETRRSGILSEETVALNASVPAILGAEAAVFTDNDAAFASKLRAIEAAERSIDLAYYIYAADESSAVLSHALVNAAERGVRVRMLLDYFNNYSRLDHFSMLEQEGQGQLEVRFYNRPTVNIIKDAVFLTLGCGDVAADAPLAECGAAKYAEIDRRFAGLEAPLNYNSGGSGAFLSGLYGQNLDLLVHAVQEGQALDKLGGSSGDRKLGEADVDRLVEFATVYWKARPGNRKRFAQLTARVKLNVAFSLHGETLDPIRDALTAYLPVEYRDDSEAALLDWGYLTDFLHHKLLLVDERRAILGGRNVENAYHMRQNPLLTHYAFLDTDIEISTGSEILGFQESFERLWNFHEMVATLTEVRQHAPNDLLVANRLTEAACAGQDTRGGGEQECGRAIAKTDLALGARLEAERIGMTRNAQSYRDRYTPQVERLRAPTIPVDAGARLYYVENLPLARDHGEEKPQRLYGAINGREGDSAKHIHELWLAGMQSACRDARPQEVIWYSAYLFPPSNMLRQLARMVNGEMDCSNVRVTILTNSAETTDLSIINLMASPVMKSLADFYRERRHPRKGAEIRYFEYRPRFRLDGKAAFSHHSKVMLLGKDVFIGAANADVRSYMMDSNNGVLIRAAPELVAHYRARIAEITTDPSRTRDRGRYYQEVSREQLREAQSDDLKALVVRVLGESPVAEKLPMEHLAERLQGVLDHIYVLTGQILREPGADTDAQRRFNALFRLI